MSSQGLAGLIGCIDFDEVENMRTPPHHSRILAAAGTHGSLDAIELNHLEHTFRTWADGSKHPVRRLSRKRILLIFLLIRYTGGRLNEILSIDPARDVDFERHIVSLRKSGDRKNAATGRPVRIAETLAEEIRTSLTELEHHYPEGRIFKVDPAHVRRRFYACADAAGLARESGTPEAIRKARAVELMQANMPLPVVQKILGHSTPNLAAAYVDFSEEEIRQVERFYIDREEQRKTSARNAFYGKVDGIAGGDVQATVEIITVDGLRVVAVITRYSLSKLALKPGSLVAAEVKAPWVMIYGGRTEPACSAENRFRGTVTKIVKGKVSTEVDIGITESTQLCALITEAARRLLDVKKGDAVWALFNAAAVVIHADG